MIAPTVDAQKKAVMQILVANRALRRGSSARAAPANPDEPIAALGPRCSAKCNFTCHASQ
jgi:hypothetical protein